MKQLVHLSLLALLVSPAHAQWRASGYVDLNASTNSGADAWNARGTGVIGSGEDVQSEARLGLNWSGDSRWRSKIELLARAQSDDDLGRSVGLLQAFVDYGALDEDQFRVRIGHAFAGSSMENLEEFWQTPFGISFSTLNSWIGEEFRPIGVESAFRFLHESGSTDFGAQVFIGNDTGPAALAWRGFANHQRLSVLGETLPLFPLPSLAANDQFAAQRNAGSQPFGPDLDHRIGYLLRAKRQFESGRLSLMWVDNRGDRALHDGDEYAWKTHFWIAGFQKQLSQDWSLFGESLLGRTQMGFPPGANVEFDFTTSYLTLTHEQGRWTQSLRIENFRIKELDRSIAELNTQHGNLLALSLLLNQDQWRFGAEILYGDINRPGNAEFFADPDQSATQIQLLVRRYF